MALFHSQTQRHMIRCFFIGMGLTFCSNWSYKILYVTNGKKYYMEYSIEAFRILYLRSLLKSKKVFELKMVAFPFLFSTYILFILQLAYVLFGVLGGPLLGMFTLGMLFPWANKWVCALSNLNKII